jgi:hypothetical protein
MSEQAPATGIEVVNELHEQAIQTTIEAENQKLAEQAAAQARQQREQQEARAKSWIEPGNARSKDDFDALQNHLQKLDQWQVRKDRAAAKRTTSNADENVARTRVGITDAYLSGSGAGKISAASHDRYMASLKQQETSADKYGKMGLKELAETQAQAELDADRTTKEDLQPFIDAKLNALSAAHNARKNARSVKHVTELDAKGDDVDLRATWEARIEKTKAAYKEGKEQQPEASGYTPTSSTKNHKQPNADTSKDDNPTPPDDPNGGVPQTTTTDQPQRCKIQLVTTLML